MSYKDLAISLFNLEDDDIKTIECTNLNDDIIIDVFLNQNIEICPNCGNDKNIIKQYVTKKIKHSILSDKNCILNYHARRYICPICNRSFYEKNPFVFKGSKISAYTVLNVLKDLKNYNETFSSVAKRYNISPTTCASIFDSHVMMNRLSLNEYLCIDECYAFNNKDLKSKYVCMILDYKLKSPIDILPSRRKEYLLKYFKGIPKDERDKVKMVSSDMYGVYQDVIHEVFPKALHVIDHYHLSQELSRVVDKIRIRIMNSIGKYDKDKNITDGYYLLKKFNWLLFKRYDSKTKDDKLLFDPNITKKDNKHFKEYLNYFDLRSKIMALHPELYSAWSIWDDFAKLYDENDKDSIEEALDKLINIYKDCGIKEITNFIRLIKSWKAEIINSFIIIDSSYKVDKETGHVVVSNHKLNNGLMENRNSILKCIKKNSNGYTNWDRFRNRCLYVLRKDANPILNPIDK